MKIKTYSFISTIRRGPPTVCSLWKKYSKQTILACFTSIAICENILHSLPKFWIGAGFYAWTSKTYETSIFEPMPRNSCHWWMCLPNSSETDTFTDIQWRLLPFKPGRGRWVGFTGHLIIYANVSDLLQTEEGVKITWFLICYVHWVRHQSKKKYAYRVPTSQIAHAAIVNLHLFSGWVVMRLVARW